MDEMETFKKSEETRNRIEKIEKRLKDDYYFLFSVRDAYDDIEFLLSLIDPKSYV